MNNGGVEELKKRYQEEIINTTPEKAAKKLSREIVINKEDSNQILMYYGSYKVKTYSTGITREYLTYEDDPRATYKLYMDIETFETYKVDIDKTYEFEKKFPIVKVPVVYNNYQEYARNFEKTRNKFLLEVITSSQDRAVKKILNKKKNNLSI